MNKQGYFLIETIIYLLLFSLIIMIMLRANIGSITQLSQTREQIKQLSSIQLLLAKFIRDIECAPASVDSWVTIKTDELIWKTDKQAIGWIYENNSIIRRQGTYYADKHQWGKKTKSVGAKNINTLTFAIEKSDEVIRSVGIELKAKISGHEDKIMSGKSWLQNRNLK